ncbi:hypothetical protein [Streptomyces sp. NPDC058486]|uniref:hypothetical protein n=1 Tax=unclassified Streptomyces TaxID=2593676 RepID=UPI0036569EF6
MTKNRKRVALALISTIASAGVLLPAATSYAAPAVTAPAFSQAAPALDAKTLSSLDAKALSALDVKSLDAKALAALDGKAPSNRVQAAQPGTKAWAVAVEVIIAVVGLAEQIYNITVGALEAGQNRGGYVKSLMEGAFYDSGQRYNVMVINDANRYTMDLKGIVFDGKVKSNYGTYRVIAFESGTFVNHGDGGWINWAFQGWFNRDGGNVTFYRSW